MKKILLSVIASALFAGVSAQLRLTEQFANPPFSASGPLGTQNSWVQDNAGVDVQVVFRANNTGALVYPGYESGRTSVSIVQGGMDPYKLFNAIVPSTANSVLFLSFLIRVTAAETGDYCVSFRQGTGYTGRVFVRATAAAPGINFGIETNGSGTGIDWTGMYSYNTTYLIVVRYDINSLDNDDDAYLWVNPSVLTEPLPGTEQASVTNTGDNNNTSFNGLVIRQGGTNAPTAELDAFKVAVGTGQTGTPANASAAWTNLSPQGAILPVTLGSIKAFEKQAGIQIDWTAYQESNLDNYQVERSADGASFTVIGTVTARNAVTETQYGFFDPSPLAGVNFYRIRNNDFDGRSGYSNIVKVNLDKSVKDITLYPNPVRGGYLSFQSSELGRGNYTVIIFNAAGQRLYTQRFNHTGGAINQTLQLPANTRSGMYTLQLDNDGIKVMSKTFMVQQ